MFWACLVTFCPHLAAFSPCLASFCHIERDLLAAVNSAKGLVVPNIKAVQSQSVFEIAGELERLVALAQEGTLPADDLADGTENPQNCSPLGHAFKTNLLTIWVLGQGHLRCRTLGRLEGRMRPRW